MLNRGNTRTSRYTATSDGITTSVVRDNKFNKIDRGPRFDIPRPAFLRGETIEGKKNVKIPADIRTGTGNRNIRRNNFERPGISGRQVVDFAKLQARDLSDGGLKVQFGEKALEQLFKVQVADTNDVEWLLEYDRRRSAGDSLQQLLDMPPLGRPQRQVFQMRNFGEQGANLGDKLELLSVAISQGVAETTNGQALMIAELAKLLDTSNLLNVMTAEQVERLGRIVARLPLPKNYIDYGLTHRLYTWEQYNPISGFVNLFLLSNIPEGRSIEHPLVSVTQTKAGGVVTGLSKTLMRLSSMVPSLQQKDGNRRYLDVENREIITAPIAYDLANSGVDGGVLNEQIPAPGTSWAPSNAPSFAPKRVLPPPPAYVPPTGKPARSPPLLAQPSNLPPPPSASPSTPQPGPPIIKPPSPAPNIPAPPPLKPARAPGLLSRVFTQPSKTRRGSVTRGRI